ncbi:MAG: hypothetical protein K8R69_10235, partial [Deltaproteobacteria bacterium]|nr:hypothetical protein [Deltaproteobacteria bacterium]
MHLRSISFLLLALYCFFTVSPHGIQAATTPIAGLTAAKPATTLPAATSSLANAQAAKTAAPLVCGKITSLQGLLQTNENSHGSAVALKELLKPIISRFKDLSAPEIETLLRGDPEAFNKALSSPLYANSYGIFIQNLRRLNVEANRLFSGMTQAGCLSPKELRSSKDFRTLTAVYFQQWLYSTATPLLRSTTRRLAPEYDDQYIIADQIPFTIMKSGIEDQCANQIAALQKLALYLAGAGEFDLSLFELSLFYGGELILK